MGTLVIDNLVAGYGSGPDILKGLSLTVESCKTYCIIGPNGAGKSTLLKVVAGLIKPREGKITYKGEVLNGLRPDQILQRGLCYIPSDRSLFPDMTVKENLRMGGFVLRNPRLVEQRLEEIFVTFPVLKEKSSQMARTLSGGQQQLTSIARTLILKPDLIMLDEPSLGLSPKVVQQIFGAIRMLREQGLTMVLVEQNARKGLGIADQGVVLDLGRNSFERPATEVLQDPRIQELYLGKEAATSVFGGKEMIQVIQILILGLALGGVYALMASGMTLIFGVMRIVNLAHAAFIILGAYIAFWLFKLYKFDPILSMVVTIPTLFIIGVIYYRLMFAPRADNPRFVDITVLITFATSLVIEGLLGFFFTGIYRSTNPIYATRPVRFGPFFVPESQLYATLISVSLILLLWLFLRYTRVGNAIRATMQNRNAAQVVGVNVVWVSMVAFGIGLAMAGASGSLLSFIFTFFPSKHIAWIGMIMSLVVLGGMGSLMGALVGSFLLASVAAFVNFYLGPIWTPITFYLALFLILLFRPQGLMGKKLEV